MASVVYLTALSMDLRLVQDVLHTLKVYGRLSVVKQLPTTPMAALQYNFKIASVALFDFILIQQIMQMYWVCIVLVV